MIIVEIEQGSPEWHSLRRTKIGASDCPGLLGKSPYKGNTPYGIWRSKVLGDESEVTPAMRRGSELEAEARDILINRVGLKFMPAVVVSSERSWQMASLDGLSDNREFLLEIKCPGQRVLGEIFKGDEIVLPEYYEWQVQHQLAVTGCKEAILFMYDGTNGIDIRILPDQVMIDELIRVEKDFWFKNVMEMEPPELQKGDYVERIDQEWLKLAQDRRSLLESMKALLGLEEANKQALIALAGDRPSTGGGVTMYKIPGRSTVDYKSIPILQDVDLTPYTKKGKEFWTVRVDKEKE